jgi:hypothetical protein
VGQVAVTDGSLPVIGDVAAVKLGSEELDPEQSLQVVSFRCVIPEIDSTRKAEILAVADRLQPLRPC